ncbi:hypothetical protein CK203_036320 [Vitis vinifera]|uniref:Uncharacterized protein n=1 Tax=Vitis vinifera TaxID=29760 RepID=A0A438HST7_VITVI|nr:hypothetical protein CK203_036320 [Vitis vinifera]
MKVGFSAWEATWRWILMIDQLKKRLVFSLFDVTWVMHFATRGNLYSLSYIPFARGMVSRLTVHFFDTEI